MASFRVVQLEGVERSRVRDFMEAEERRHHVNFIWFFEVARWGHCGEAVIAEEGGEIVGVALLAIRGTDRPGAPELDTLAVHRDYRGRGIGYDLFHQGLQRLAERTPRRRLLCRLQNSVMEKLVAKLPPELKDILDAVPEYHYSGDLSADEEEDREIRESFPDW
jgi:GNAT superfamily N-acetyltransferase